MTWGLGNYELIAEPMVPAARVLIERARPRAGERVVDVGCGNGNAAMIAAEAGARVIGLDPATRLLELAAERAESEGLEIEFLCGEAAVLPLPDGAADAVISSFGAIFAPDPARALAEMARVSAPRGRIALSAWIPGGAISAVARLRREAIAPAGNAAPGVPFPWHEEKAVARLLEPHGFAIDASDHELPFTADSIERFAEAEFSCHPLWIATRRVLEHSEVEELRRRALEIFSEANEDPEAFRVTSRYRVFVARRP